MNDNTNNDDNDQRCSIVGNRLICPINHTVTATTSTSDSGGGGDDVGGATSTTTTIIVGNFTCPLDGISTWPWYNPADDLGYCTCNVRELLFVDDDEEDGSSGSSSSPQPDPIDCDCLICPLGAYTPYSYACHRGGGIVQPLFGNCFNYSCDGQCNVPIDVSESDDDSNLTQGNGDGNEIEGPSSIVDSSSSRGVLPHTTWLSPPTTILMMATLILLRFHK